MADEADLKDVKQSFNDLNNNNINSKIQDHLDPSNEVSKALNQAKQSADLANEANKVEETFKCPLYFADKPEWVDDLNKASDPIIARLKKNWKKKDTNLNLKLTLKLSHY